MAQLNQMIRVLATEVCALSDRPHHFHLLVVDRLANFHEFFQRNGSEFSLIESGLDIRTASASTSEQTTFSEKKTDIEPMISRTC